MELKEQNYWSPSREEAIIKTQKQQQEKKASLFATPFVQEFINTPNDGTETQGRILGTLMGLEAEMYAYMERGKADRIAELETTLAYAIEEGRLAEAALGRASAGVMVARQNHAALENWHNRATLALAKAKNQPLGMFHRPEDEVAKADAIREAQADLDQCIAAMQEAAIDSVPIAMNRKIDAERKLSAIAARVKAYRAELAALQGGAVPAVGTVQSATGLVG